MNRGGAGAQVCRWWVGRYTRACPPDVARPRAEEIESDLWEHCEDAKRRGVSRLGHDVDVFRRVLSGVPADLSWRREVLRSRPRSSSEGVPVMSRTRRFASASTIVVAALATLPALSLWPLLGTGGSGALSGREIAWIIGATALGFVLLAGMVLRAREQAPRLGTALLVVGGPAPAMAWFWLPPLYVLSLLVIVLALVTHPRHRGASVAI